MTAALKELRDKLAAVAEGCYEGDNATEGKTCTKQPLLTQELSQACLPLIVVAAGRGSNAFTKATAGEGRILPDWRVLPLLP